MEVKILLLAITSTGIITAVGEKLLNVFGKGEMANFLNIAGLSGIGIIALGLVYKLIELLGTL